MKTEFNKVQGLFDASAGNSFSLSHAKPSLRAEGSIAIPGASFTNDESFTLTDALGQSVTFKVDTAVNTVDGSVDADGNVILGTNGAAAGAAQITALVAVVNAVSAFDQSAQNGAPAGQKDLKLDILAVAETTTARLYQKTNGASGNTTISTFDNAGDAAALTTGTVTSFSGGKDEGTAETATGIHYLLEEVSIDQTTLAAGDNVVVAQLSHKLPENAVILRACLTHSSVDSDVDADSGDYELFICDTSKAVGAAQGGNSIEIADKIATTSTSVGTTTATSIRGVGNEQFIQLVTAANNAAENGTVKFLVAIQYAGMGEPIKI